MPFSASLFRLTRYVLGHGQSVWLFLSRNDDGNVSETVAKSSTARRSAIEAANLLQDRGSTRITDASKPGGLVPSPPSIFVIADGDDAAGARRMMRSEEPRHDPRVADAAINGLARRVPRDVRADESSRASVVASPEEIALAQQLRLELERKYLNEPR
jgi:hypothetical protein